jgi:hypothetical protein
MPMERTVFSSEEAKIYIRFTTTKQFSINLADHLDAYLELQRNAGACVPT